MILKGDGTWPFEAKVDGDDLVVRGHYATWFGGNNDPMDGGSTASGISTKGNPDILGCSLPMHIGPRSGSKVTFEPTHGSPLPKLPWKTQVRVWCPETNKIIVVELIDLGPAKWACEKGNCLDLTQAAFRALGVSAKRGRVKVDYRILGGAEFVPPRIFEK